MILKSREEQGRLKRAGRLIHPKKSHGRTVRYWGKRLMRIRATPHALALGTAIGVFAAFSPALGVHFLFAIALAFVLRANMVAAGVATAAANPLTYPFMIAGDFEIGRTLFGHQGSPSISMHEILGRLASFDFHGMWEPIFKPLFFGSVILGGVFAVAVYFMVYFAALAFEQGRAQRRSRSEEMQP